MGYFGVGETVCMSVGPLIGIGMLKASVEHRWCVLGVAFGQTHGQKEHLAGFQINKSDIYTHQYD